jgi:hypothetical protein
MRNITPEFLQWAAMMPARRSAFGLPSQAVPDDVDAAAIRRRACRGLRRLGLPGPLRQLRLKQERLKP